MPQATNFLKCRCIHQAMRQLTTHDEFAPLRDHQERDQAGLGKELESLEETARGCQEKDAQG